MLQLMGEGRIRHARSTALLALVTLVAAAPGCGPREDDSLPESTPADEAPVERPAGEDATGPATGSADPAAQPGDTAPAAEPALSVSPRQGAPGTEIRIEAVGLPPNQRIRLGTGPVESEYEIIAETRSDGQGRVAATVSVPSWAEPGDRFIFVAETPDHETKVLSDPFEVTGPGGTSP